MSNLVSIFVFFVVLVFSSPQVIAGSKRIKVVFVLSSPNPENTFKSDHSECATMITAIRNILNQEEEKKNSDERIREEKSYLTSIRHTVVNRFKRKPPNRIECEIFAQEGGGWQVREPGSSEITTFETFNAQNEFPFLTEKPFNSFKQLDEFLTGYSKEKGPKSIIMIITEHGERRAAGTSFLTWGPPNSAFSVGDLKKTIREVASPECRVWIVCIPCFGGAVHEIAREINHVCTLSVTNPFMISQDRGASFSFLKGFWSELENNPAASLAEAAFGSLSGEATPDNLGLESISSADFIDYKLQEGVYHPGIQSLLFDNKLNRSYPNDNLSSIPPYVIFRAIDEAQGGQPPIINSQWHSSHHFTEETLELMPGEDQQSCFHPIQNSSSKFLASPNEDFLSLLQSMRNSWREDWCPCLCSRPSRTMHAKIPAGIEPYRKMLEELKTYEYSVQGENKTLRIPNKLLRLLSNKLTQVEWMLKKKLRGESDLCEWIRKMVAYQAAEKEFFRKWVQIYQEDRKLRTQRGQGESNPSVTSQDQTETEGRLQRRIQEAQEAYKCLMEKHFKTSARCDEKDWICVAGYTLKQIHNYKQFFLSPTHPKIQKTDQEKLLNLLNQESESLLY